MPLIGLWLALALITPGAALPFGEAGFVLGPVNANDARFEAVEVDARGRLVVGGHFEIDGGQRAAILLRYLGSGELDPSFGKSGVLRLPHSGFDDRVLDIALDGNGRILAAGQRGELMPWVARFLPDGGIDPAFSKVGRMLRPLKDPAGGGRLYSITVDHAGRIVVAGVAIGRVPRGWLGTTFLCKGGSGRLCTKRVQIGFVARLKVDGRPDERFGRLGFSVGNVSGDNFYTGPHDELMQVLVRPDGRLIAVGWVAGPTSDEERSLMVGYAADGNIDRVVLGPEVSRANGHKEVFYAAALMTRTASVPARVIAAGFSFDRPAESRHIQALIEGRTLELQLDPSYAGGRGFSVAAPRGLAGSPIEYLAALRVDPMGRAVAVGFTDDRWAYGSEVDRALIVRYSDNGIRDRTWPKTGASSWIAGQSMFAGGTDDAFVDVVILHDGRTCAVGTSGGHGLIACYTEAGFLAGTQPPPKE